MHCVCLLTSFLRGCYFNVSILSPAQTGYPSCQLSCPCAPILQGISVWPPSHQCHTMLTAHLFAADVFQLYGSNGVCQGSGERGSTCTILLQRFSERSDYHGEWNFTKALLVKSPPKSYYPPDVLNQCVLEVILQNRDFRYHNVRFSEQVLTSMPSTLIYQQK